MHRKLYEVHEVSETPEKPEITQSTAHNFTKDGKESEYFNIEGNLGTDKTGISYDNTTLTKYLKIESSTDISFETDKEATLTLVLNSDFTKYIVVDGVKYQAQNGIVTVELEKGKHTVKKADTAKLYFMSIR